MSFSMWNVGDFTWSSWIFKDSQVKKGIKKVFIKRPSIRKTHIRTNFHVVFAQWRQKVWWPEQSCRFWLLIPQLFLPSRYHCIALTLFCFCSLVTFWKCRVALTMATLHSSKLSWRWTLLRSFETEFILLFIHQHLSCLLFEASRQSLFAKS